MGKIWPKNRVSEAVAHRSQAVLQKNAEFDVGSGGVCGELDSADMQYLMETDTIQLGDFSCVRETMGWYCQIWVFPPREIENLDFYVRFPN